MSSCTPAVAVAAGLLLLAGVTDSREPDSAIQQWQRLRAELHSSRTANDWQASLASASKLRALLNDAPQSLLEVARAEVRLGDVDAALRAVDQFSRMGQVADLPALSEDFSALARNDSYPRIRDAMAANSRPVSLASPAVLLSDTGLLAEDIDYDPRSRRFFITGVREKKIISVGVRGDSAEFANAPDGWPMVAIKVDGARALVWATEVAFKDFSSVPQADRGRSALLCFDLNNGRLLLRIEAPRPSALGDMVLTERGDVIVSDGDGGGVYRLRARGASLQRIDRGDFISPQTPALDPDGRHLFVPDYVRGIAVMDLSSGQARWLSTQARFALNGVDGLYFVRGRLIAVQNGTLPERVVAFTLDATHTRVVSETVIERATGTLGDPTHGTVVGDEFYYIADSGWDSLDDHGDVKPDARPFAPRIMRVRLAAL